MTRTAALLACLFACTPAPAPTPAPSSCANLAPAMAGPADLERCLGEFIADDPQRFQRWAVARITAADLAAEVPPPAVLAAVEAAIPGENPTLADLKLRLDLARNHELRGDAEAARSHREFVLTTRPDEALTPVIAAAHLALAESETPARCDHLAAALRLDGTLEQPLRTYYAAKCAKTAVLCDELLALGRPEQARVCLHAALAADANGEEFPRLAVRVYSQVALASRDELLALIAGDYRLKKYLDRVERCEPTWAADNYEIGSDGIYLLLARTADVDPTTRRCYLQTAAAICLYTLRSMQNCVAPESLVGLLRAAPTEMGEHLAVPLQDDVLALATQVRLRKRGAYREMEAKHHNLGECQQDHTETLFYLHYALAELYLRHPTLAVQKSRFLHARGQVCRMREMYRRTFNKDIAPADEPAGAADIDCSGIQRSICSDDP